MKKIFWGIKKGVAGVGKVNGNSTIEASIFFPIIFFCTLIFVYIALFFYNQISLQNLSQKISQSICTKYFKKSGDLYFEIKEIENNYLERVVNDELSGLYKPGMLIFVRERPNVDLEICSNGFINKEINISLSAKMKSPSGNIFRALGLGDGVMLKVNSRGTLKENGSFYHLVDYASIKTRLANEQICNQLEHFEDIIKADRIQIIQTIDYFRKE